MEVKINYEIRNYTESMFFGLSLRQFVFSLLAVGVAVRFYFLLRPYLGTETVSWVCILGTAPFAALGFVSYHGMTAEQFLWAWVRKVGNKFSKTFRFTDINYQVASKEDKGSMFLTYSELLNSLDSGELPRRSQSTITA